MIGDMSPISGKKGSVHMASAETANVGRAVAARVGTNIREVRTRLGMTQAQLAAPEFSISYISAIERGKIRPSRSEEHTSELQSPCNLVCRLLLEKKKKTPKRHVSALLRDPCETVVLEYDILSDL